MRKKYPLLFKMNNDNHDIFNCNPKSGDVLDDETIKEMTDYMNLIDVYSS